MFDIFRKEFPEDTVVDISTNRNKEYDPTAIYVKELNGGDFYISDDHFAMLSQQIRRDPQIAAFIAQNKMSEEQILQLTKQIYSQQNLEQLAEKNDIIVIQYQRFSFLSTPAEQSLVVDQLRKIKTSGLKPASKCLICFDDIKQTLVNSCLQCLDGMCMSCASQNMGSHASDPEGIVNKCPKCRKSMVIKN